MLNILDRDSATHPLARYFHPLTESHPWPTEEVSLVDFTYTIDLSGWWPDIVRSEVVLD